MANIQSASGEQIYEAAIEGAKRKFNRSTDDYSVYEAMLHEFYELMLLDKNNKAACDRVRKRTKNNCIRNFLKSKVSNTLKQLIKVIFRFKAK